jgi:hypothetical protein
LGFREVTGIEQLETRIFQGNIEGKWILLEWNPQKNTVKFFVETDTKTSETSRWSVGQSKAAADSVLPFDLVLIEQDTRLGIEVQHHYDHSRGSLSADSNMELTRRLAHFDLENVEPRRIPHVQKRNLLPETPENLQLWEELKADQIKKKRLGETEDLIGRVKGDQAEYELLGYSQPLELVFPLLKLFELGQQGILTRIDELQHRGKWLRVKHTDVKGQVDIVGSPERINYEFLTVETRYVSSVKNHIVLAGVRLEWVYLAAQFGWFGGVEGDIASVRRIPPQQLHKLFATP